MSDENNTQTNALTIEDIKNAFSEVIDAKLQANNEVVLSSVDEKLAAIKPVAPKKGKDEPSEAETTLQALHEANMAGLSDEDKEMILDLAGDNVLQQVKIFSKLQKRGKFKASPASTTQTDDLGGGDDKKEDTDTKEEKKPDENGADKKPEVRHTSTRVNLSGNTAPSAPTSFIEAGKQAQAKLQASQR